MSKPTIFFSHSSKDKEFVLEIKNKIESITKGTLDIFMSSDGQSIPFGTNWVYKVEDGLNASSIMFLFVTENSLSSGWLYFEAGFAYNKGIEVIPVGFGVDVATLNFPLNMLQGYNVVSGESLNNYISILNRKFSTSYDESFNEADYDRIIRLVSTIEKVNIINDLIDCVQMEIYDIDLPDGVYIKDIFDGIYEYLKANDIHHALKDYNSTTNLLFQGIDVFYQYGGPEHENEALTIILSSFNYLDSYTLLSNIFAQFEGFEEYCLLYRLSDQYDCVSFNYDVSSHLIHSNEFKMNEEVFGWYYYKDESFLVTVNSRPTSYGKDSQVKILSPLNSAAVNTIELILLKLLETGVIFEKKNGDY